MEVVVISVGQKVLTIYLAYVRRSKRRIIRYLYTHYWTHSWPFVESIGPTNRPLISLIRKPHKPQRMVELVAHIWLIPTGRVSKRVTDEFQCPVSKFRIIVHRSQDHRTMSNDLRAGESNRKEDRGIVNRELVGKWIKTHTYPYQRRIGRRKICVG